MGKGDSVNLFNLNSVKSNAPVVKEGHISGLGNVSHIDRSCLTNEIRLSDGGESQKKPSIGNKDEFNDN